MDKLSEFLVVLVDKLKLDKVVGGFILAWYAYGKGGDDTLKKAQEILNERLKKHSEGIVNLKRDPAYRKWLLKYYSRK